VTSDDVNDLKAKLAQAQQLFSQAVIEGQELKFSGPGFSFGIADTVANAEPGLQNDKARREREGLRAGRGERPSGVSNADQRDDGAATEDVPDGVTQGEDSAVGGVSPDARQPGLIGNVVLKAHTNVPPPAVQ